jgi:hypothetical protein
MLCRATALIMFVGKDMFVGRLVCKHNIDNGYKWSDTASTNSVLKKGEYII